MYHHTYSYYILCNTRTIYQYNREFTQGDLVKGGLAIYACTLCNCNTLGSVFNMQIEHMPNCLTPLY